MVGPGRGGLSPAALAAALDYIRGHPQIWEVILTGGDPLVLSARRLKDVVTRARRHRPRQGDPRPHPRAGRGAGADHRRAGARAARAGQGDLCRPARQSSARTDADKARAACARLVDAGMPMLGQTVLLRGVNDDAETLGALMRALVECRIKPYYLHHADLAPGTAHLRTTIAEGQALMRALRGRYSGLCQPAYVLDIPGGHGKSPIGPNYLERRRHGDRGFSRGGGTTIRRALKSSKPSKKSWSAKPPPALAPRRILWSRIHNHSHRMTSCGALFFR